MSHESSNTRTCWNCDEVVEDLAHVVISTPTGGKTTLNLCPRCYASVYQPLEAEVQALGPLQERQRTVLLVDDDPDMLGALSMWLHDEGFEVLTAANRLEALQRLQDQAPEVIVLDLQMPIMSGQEFLKVWRSTTPNAAIPVVAMSGYQPEIVADELGVEAFLSKPFCLSALTRAIIDAVA